MAAWAHEDEAGGTEYEWADVIGASFLASFEKNARYFTNGTYGPTDLSGWNPLTDATFDTGVVAVCDSMIGILWVEDGD